uniref:Uncharacterized protein n=1 Tax=Sphaerodactylus townsendi TaxID=933632 RepID=A0ACB8EV25_9SAUR
MCRSNHTWTGSRRGLWEDCPLLGKSFRSSHHLKVHLTCSHRLAHTKCPHCDYAGTQSGSLNLCFPLAQLSPKSHGPFPTPGRQVLLGPVPSRRKPLLNGKADFQPLDLSLRPTPGGGALHAANSALRPPQLLSSWNYTFRSTTARKPNPRCSHTAPKPHMVMPEEEQGDI